MIKELMREVTFTQASWTSTKARGSDCSVQSSPGLGVWRGLDLGVKMGSQWAGYEIILAWPEASASHLDVAELQNTAGMGKPTRESTAAELDTPN